MSFVPMLNRLGLRARITTWTTVIVGLSLAAGLGWVRHSLRRVLETEDDALLQRKSQELLAAARDETGGMRALWAEVDREVAAYRDEGLVIILHEARRRRLAPADPISAELADCLDEAKFGKVVTVELPKTHQRFRVLRTNDERLKLDVALSLAGTQSTLSRFDQQLGTGSIVFLGAAVLGGLLLARQSLRPVTASIEQAKQLNPADLSARLPRTGADDELDRLAATINRLLDRLADYHQQIVRFTADAAHELRSPLAVMRAAIEVTLQETRPAIEYQEVLGTLAEQCDRLTSLVNQLLLLATADSGQVSVLLESVDVSQLVSEIVEMYEPLADEAGISLRCEVAGPLMVSGDPDRLRQLVGNLLDNAIKFSAPRGGITARASSDTDRAVVTIADTGSGIPPDRVAHIFERFYQADPGRSSNGFGLGLSICRLIATAHQGSVELVHNSTRGATFAIRLPLTTPAAAGPGIVTPTLR